MITNLVSNNPYRFLGVYSNSPKKDVLSNLNKMKAFLKVGKEVSFPLDLPNFLPAIKRTEAIVAAAQSAIELPIDQLKHTLFWFMKATPIDDVAFNHLISGNMDQAKDIWSKKESVSSLLNLMTCAIIEQDDTALSLNADKLFQNYSVELCASVNETIKFTPDELLGLFVELLKNDSQVDLAKFTRISGTSMSWQKAFGASLVKPLIDRITAAINEAKSAKGSAANYSAGVTLMNSTKNDLSQLKSLVGTSDMQYQMIADKLAQTILQCGINYFNDSNDDDAPQKAMALQKYALSIAVGQLAKDRCKENIDILQKIGPEYAIRKEMDSIGSRLKNFNGKGRTRGLQNPYGVSESILDSLRDDLYDSKITSASTFVTQCKPDLNSIKRKLGSTDELYLKISSAVASAAINAIVEAVNAAQKKASIQGPYGVIMIKGTISSAVTTMSLIGGLDMDAQCRNYYQGNNTTLCNINSQLNPAPKPTPSSSSGGCYIATMAYGDYDHPQVMVLRDFRDSFLAKETGESVSSSTIMRILPVGLND